MTYTDYDSLFERFAIMTVDGRLSDAEALKRLQHQTTPELFQKLKSYLAKQ